MKVSAKKVQKNKLKHFNKLREEQFKEKMDKTTLLLFPNQLLALDKLAEIIKENKVARIIFIEHPIYYGYHSTTKTISTRTEKKYNYNKLKIIYHIAANLYYTNEILGSNSITKSLKIDIVDLFDFNGFSGLAKKLKITSTYQSPVVYIDTLNTELNKEIQKAFKQNIELVSPLLLTSKGELAKYSKKHTGKQNHSAFYKWQKQRLKILTEEKKTYDIQQRIPKNEIKSIPDVAPISSSIDKKYLTMALKHFKQSRDYSSIFSKNSGPTITDISVEEHFLFPVSHKGAEEYLKYFITKKFSKFTKYQDSIVSGHERHKTQLYHAGISPMMNIGLLLAEDILEVAKNAYKQQRDIDKAAYESFIRQIIGWREYQYYIYCFHRERLEGANYFANNGKLTTEWYTGTTGVGVVDDAIKTAFNYGYLHHIMRLMVVCNFMNLCMIEPTEVFRWFMEFSLDSYEWVMYCNVYSMGIWSDGGVAMRKPYIASDAYISKMSNYLQVSKEEKAGVKEWMRVWYALFYNFINVKQHQIKKTYYAGMIKNWQNKSTQEQKELTQIANEFLNGGYKIQNNKQNIQNNKVINGGSEMKIGWYNDEDLKNFITENASRINEFKDIVKLDSLELIKNGVSSDMNGGDRLIDIIFTGDDMDLNELKNIKIWSHGILDDNNKDDLISSITAGVNGVHYYIIIKKNNELQLVGSFIRG
jgi:deoxyribodipyrimidine photolyase-related protein